MYPAARTKTKRKNNYAISINKRPIYTRQQKKRPADQIHITLQIYISMSIYISTDISSKNSDDFCLKLYLKECNIF